MRSSLLLTLLDLGHNTSQNLEFVYGNPGTSYGEETITETNLLEIRRRHPDIAKLITFSKIVESRNTGADWEWYIIGSVWTYKLRVQAKRITKFGTIPKLYHKAKTAPSSQIDLLISSARSSNMKPVYCFYCAESHRSIWKTGSVKGGYFGFESGCLIADANDLYFRKRKLRKLNNIEAQTVGMRIQH